MSGYAKLFSSITESSLWCVCSKEARLLFVSMLARADEAGVVESSLPGLAKLASLTIDEAAAAANELESPDPYDRSGAAEGRRITKVDGGWAIVNYSVYREMRSPSERREYMKGYMQEYRKRDVNSVNSVNSSVNNVNFCKQPLAPADADADATEVNNTLAKDELCVLWNGLGHPFKKIKTWTKDRSKHLKVRSADAFWRDNWRAAIGILPKCKFCAGGGAQGWVADIDWFLKPDSVAKLIEGKYDNGGSSNGQRSDRTARVEAPAGKYANVGVRLSNTPAGARPECAGSADVGQG